MAKKKGNPTNAFLSEEDKEIWQKIASKTKPLSDKDRNRIENIEITALAKVPKLQKKNKEKTPSPTQKLVTKKPVERKTPPLAEIDRKKIRKISTDQINIRATLDLHGFRQEQAHSALKSFIRTCQASDYRYILVITGKGASKKADTNDFWADREPGVLKRSVPIWLSEPEMREYVVGYSFAHAKHGGDGALYVQLRRQRK